MPDALVPNKPPIMMVMAVKGGTGKSLNTINLALMLSKHYKVGLLDADVDSPNLPSMLRLETPMVLMQDHTFIPIDYKGIQVVSAGLFQKGIFTVCKTGREIRQIVSDMLHRSHWGPLDLILVDEPAGSDEELKAIMESGHPLLGVIVVSQPTTYDDCWRSIELCTRFKMHIIGIIENMSGAVWQDGSPVVHPETKQPYLPLGQPNDGKEIEKLAISTGITFLGRIPLVENMYARIHAGNPCFPESVTEPLTKIVCQVQSLIPKEA